MVLFLVLFLFLFFKFVEGVEIEEMFGKIVVIIMSGDVLVWWCMTFSYQLLDFIFIFYLPLTNGK